jgi:hypothetical protein
VVDDAVTLELRSYWFPTKASAERMFRMTLEFNLNQHVEADQPTLAEVACITGSIDEALSTLPLPVPKETRAEMRRLLQPWPDGRYTPAYQRSGGILNLFTPAWGEPEDEPWAAALARWEAGSYDDEGTRQEALRTLEQEWNARPHPFFARLTPAQVMVGGGPREAALAVDFLTHLRLMYDGYEFESEGQALIAALTTLRAWQCQVQEGGQTVFQIVVAEREALLARRARALA